MNLGLTRPRVRGLPFYSHGIGAAPRKSCYIAWDFQLDHGVTTYFAFSPPQLGYRTSGIGNMRGRTGRGTACCDML